MAYAKVAGMIPDRDAVTYQGTRSLYPAVTGMSVRRTNGSAPQAMPASARRASWTAGRMVEPAARFARSPTDATIEVVR
jgi:hypothetical protein